MILDIEHCDLCGKVIRRELIAGSITIKSVNTIGGGRSYTTCRACTSKYEQLFAEENEIAQNRLHTFRQGLQDLCVDMGLEDTEDD